MGRRSRAVEQVLGEVIQQAVTEGDEINSQLTTSKHEPHVVYHHF